MNIQVPTKKLGLLSLMIEIPKICSKGVKHRKSYQTRKTLLLQVLKLSDTIYRQIQIVTADYEVCNENFRYLS